MKSWPLIGCLAWLLVTLATPTLAQIGNPLPTAKLEGFTQTQAKSLEDFVGRTLIIEFFAYG